VSGGGSVLAGLRSLAIERSCDDNARRRSPVRALGPASDTLRTKRICGSFQVSSTTPHVWAQSAAPNHRVSASANSC
jgi:hypothetical protein